MNISEIMSEGVIVAQVKDSIRIVAQIMRDNDIGALPIYDNDKPAGFVTDRDIVIACADEGSSMEDPISYAMSPDFFAVEKHKEITEVAKIMEEKQISRVIVVDGSKAVGIVSLADLTRNLENARLKAEVIEEIKQ